MKLAVSLLLTYVTGFEHAVVLGEETRVLKKTKGKGKKSKKACTKLAIEVRETWTEDLVLPDGTTVPVEALGPDLYTPGLLQYYSGYVQDAEGENIGKAYQKFIMIDSDGNSIGDGTYIDLAGCEGSITFSGPYLASTVGTGTFTVLGGTGDFLGAKGVITESYDESTGEGVRMIHLQ